MLLWAVIVSLGLLVLSAVLMRAARWGFRRLRAREVERAAEERCPCGYEIRGLAQARCPECGRVLGFDRTAEELGLSEEQLARVMEARRRREG